VATEAPSEADTAGARLARARVRLGLSVDQVADKLKLDAQTVAELEAGEHRAIGAAVFVRGFLRHYAELVGESPAEIEDLHARRPDAKLQPDLSQTGMHRIEPGALGPKLGVVPALIAATVLGVAGAVWWALRAKPPADTVVSVEQAQVLHVDGAGTDAGLSPGATPRALGALPAGAAAGSTLAAGSATPGEAGQPPARRRQLQLTFNGECWAEVYDARGMRLYFGFGHAGTTQQLSGVAPFRLVLGNVAAVAVAVEGAPVTLPAAEPGARLRVSLNGNGAVASVR
jgi:cytoskeleton protein RodZ